MEENVVKVLEYNTHREKMTLPEYGRGVQKMVEQLRLIPDKAKRSEQARAVVRVMEILNPSIRIQDNWEQRLWDHLFIIAKFDLDIDAPYPVPEKTAWKQMPSIVPIQKKPIKASHYGRNIESIIDLISSKEDGDQKTQMIKDLATYMRTQYLIWNKDSVSDETIFKDIELLSEGRVKVPEGMTLTEVSRQSSFNRPGQAPAQNKNRNHQRNNRRRGK